MTTKKDHVPVYDYVKWEDAPTQELLDFVTANHRGFGAHPVPGFGDEPKAYTKNGEQAMPQSFIEHAKEVVERMKFNATRWRYWVSEIRAEDKSPEEQWAKGFPHNHGWSGLTLVHYLQVPERGGALVIRDWERKEIARFQPEVGMTAVIDGRTEHGVEQVFGDVARRTVIATGYQL